ncbi:hypothetical protein [Aquimarina algicola]|uniref:Uncharacterized protein n=1 Tax=Aquimarina algicola TaxID=2589995 RepID=A0A504JBE8_9FLAO|nr:hypothetical protein [Aquimarina algicola]TPN87964.1 hypothetical protein FHK87_10350 [Aquimarina algicola]
MNALYKNPIAIILIVLSIVGYILLKAYLPPIDLSHLTPENVIAVLGYLSVVMFVVEQFIEIFIDDPNQKEKKECKNRISEINTYLEKINKDRDAVAIEEEPVEEENPDKVIRIMREKKALQEKLINKGLHRQQRTSIIAFVLGLVLSFSGLRLMSGIIFEGSQESLSEIQSTIIQSIDIVLTAGIIAGGSGRVHRLIKKIKYSITPDMNL